MTDFPALLKSLHDAGVQFIVVGGFAATLHGSAVLTADLDIVYSRVPSNLARLVEALSPHRPYLRGAPPGLPFRFDVETLKRGLNFTLSTDLGDVDLLGDLTGGGAFEALLSDADSVRVFGIDCRCLSLRKLIEVKRAAGHPKDLQSVAELEALLEERGEAGD